MKKALAMKCTQEQWDSIKGRIPKNKINTVTSFKSYPYLINFDDEKTISNISTTPTWKKLWEQNPEIHETFNAKIFLEACGIETTPTLEEVKEYFKDAEKIERADLPAERGQVFDISDRAIFDNRQIHFDSGYYWLCKKEIDNIMLWSSYNGYAKILTYKNKTDVYKITKEQVLMIAEKTQIIKEWFPDAFKKELVAGKWMKTPIGGLYCPKEKQGNGFICYGFTPTSRTYKEIFVLLDITKDDVEATPQEIESALIREWEKRGGVGLDLHIELNGKEYQLEKEVGKFQLIRNILFYQGAPVMNDGKWATIIQPEKMTLEQIEKELGRKIEIV